MPKLPAQDDLYFVQNTQKQRVSWKGRGASLVLFALGDSARVSYCHQTQYGQVVAFFWEAFISGGGHRQRKNTK